MAWPTEVTAPVPSSGLPGCDPDLLPDDVDPRDHLAHRMLHLDPGVHLHEIEVPSVVGQELQGARARRTAMAEQARLTISCKPLPRRGIQQRRRRLLQDLLVAALDGAVPLA